MYGDDIVNWLNKHIRYIGLSCALNGFARACVKRLRHIYMWALGAFRGLPSLAKLNSEFCYLLTSKWFYIGVPENIHTRWNLNSLKNISSDKFKYKRLTSDSGFNLNKCMYMDMYVCVYVYVTVLICVSLNYSCFTSYLPLIHH